MVTPPDLRVLVGTSPFRPFRLHLSDGKSLRVPHPDFILVAADMLAVATELAQGTPGELNLVPCEHVARVELLRRRTRNPT